MKKRNARTVGNPRSRSFQLTVKEAKKAEDIVSGTFFLYDSPMRVLFDSVANRSFISSRSVNVISCLKPKLETPLNVEVGNSSVELVFDVFSNCEI